MALKKQKVHGNSDLILEASGELTIDKSGLWTGTCVFNFPAGEVKLIPAQGAKHPYVGFLHVDRRRIVMSPGLWKVYVDYAGMEDDRDETEPTYEFSPGTGTEQIETHPDFYTIIAGPPSGPNPHTKPIYRDPVTGYISTDNATAEFDRFSLSGTLAGVESYIVQNNTIWTKTWVRKSKPVTDPIKIVDKPPGADAPDYGGNYNWLELPLRYSLRGIVYSCSQSWQCSGPKGWHPLVYPGRKK